LPFISNFSQLVLASGIINQEAMYKITVSHVVEGLKNRINRTILIKIDLIPKYQPNPAAAPVRILVSGSRNNFFFIF